MVHIYKSYRVIPKKELLRGLWVEYPDKKASTVQSPTVMIKAPFLVLGA